MTILQPPQTWQQALQRLVTQVEELCEIIPAARHHFSKAASASFPLKVGRRYLAKINKEDIHDPLLLQILPQALELQTHPEFNLLPLAELRFNPLPGLLHKYRTGTITRFFST